MHYQNQSNIRGLFAKLMNSNLFCFVVGVEFLNSFFSLSAVKLTVSLSMIEWNQLQREKSCLFLDW